MGLSNSGYARTPYANDRWWFDWCMRWLGSRKSTFPTDIDLIRFKLIDGVLVFALIESKCLEGRRMKTHQQKTFQMLDQLLFGALNYEEPKRVTFRVKGKAYTYPVRYAGFFLCNSYACDEECNDLLDVDEDPTTDPYGILSGEAYTAKLDFLLRAVSINNRKECNWMMLVRRFTGEEIDTKTAFILRLIEAVVVMDTTSKMSQRFGGQFYGNTHDITGVYRVDKATFHGLHLLEYDSPDIDRANLRWDGKPSDLRAVVEHMTFGRIKDATPPGIKPPAPPPLESKRSNY